MSGLVTHDIQCPSCWETFETVVDCSVLDQEYVEDCYVCCRPMLIHVVTDGDAVITLEVEAEHQ